ncbi:MAG: hypothetical protein ABIF85_00890 [Nanoarchaeota archaeon]|nr:hypothetical protein [Nanoarchaeota archaeon]MBU4300482.1 hypothetical protein [Nanoarchaeota archaeon]MBU4451962.1 hypothetical protein [Nanoarchaeota archaeon]MCG2724121.1 hypothetical protein [archaeon]
MDEKLSDMEIEKLRAIVGLDSETESFSDEKPIEETKPVKNTQIPEKPRSYVSVNPYKKPEERASSAIDTELFVKVEEHAAIGKKLAEAKGDMKVIADTVSLLAKAEKLKSEAITRMEVALDKIDAEIEEIESKLVAPEGLHVPEISGSIASDEFIDLRSELDSLKSELGGIKK